MTSEQWATVQQDLRGRVGKNNFDSWIKPLQFQQVTDGVAVFKVPTSFVGNYVNTNYGDDILTALHHVGAPVSRLSFEVAANLQKAPRPSDDQVEAAKIAAKGSEIDGSPLDARFTFDSFIVGKPNELAYSAARRVATGAQVTFNPLFLYGGVGLGKTHLMHAIAHELKINQPQLNVLYLSAEQFMYRFITALRERKMIDFKQLFRSVDVLMVDDVQFIAGKDSTQEEFFHTFNALIDGRK